MCFGTDSRTNKDAGDEVGNRCLKSVKFGRCSFIIMFINAFACLLELSYLGGVCNRVSSCNDLKVGSRLARNMYPLSIWILCHGRIDR